jgi:hypothetical protein
MWMKVGLAAAVVGTWILIVVRPEEFATGVTAYNYADWEVVFASWAGHISSAGIAISMLSLLVTVWAWRRAPKGTPTRSTAGRVAASFALRDFVIIVLMVELSLRLRYLPLGASPFWDAFHITWYPLGLLAFYLALAYSILRYQLFDIDLKIKAGLARSLVMGVIAGAFFVAAETLEGALPFNSYWAGLVAAGSITAAIVPLQKGAHRIADRLMPNTQDTPEYRGRRSEEVYRAAFEAAAQDGRLTAREEKMLASLARDFGFTPETIRRLRRIGGT